MDDHSLSSSQSKVLYVRHGATEFNLLEKKEKIKDSIKLNDIYYDCNLSEKGKLQVKEFSKILTNMEITTCFVSPLNRCLESISLALQDHPNKNNIIIYIEPNLTEFITGSQHNLPKNILDKKRKFNIENQGLNFDWTFFDKFVENSEFKDNQNLYFIEYIDNKTNNFHEIINKLKQEFSNENVNFLLDSYSRSSIKKPETYSNLLKRCKNVKKILGKFISQSEKKELILVMTHSAIIKMSSSNLVDKLDSIDKYPDDAYLPGHTDILEVQIN
jgi:broad specificity phosphatase PhoE